MTQSPIDQRFIDTDPQYLGPEQYSDSVEDFDMKELDEREPGPKKLGELALPQ